VNQRYDTCRQYVGIDLHRRRSVVLRMDGEGEVVDSVRIDNSVPNLVAEVAKAGAVDRHRSRHTVRPTGSWTARRLRRDR